MKAKNSLTMVEIVAEINKRAGTTLKPTAFKNKALALARLHSVMPKGKTDMDVHEANAAKLVKQPLIATAEEVKELQAIRDLRLANKAYTTKKTAFFKKFRAKYGITTDSRIKVETEDPAKLGVTQYVSNSRCVTV